jgi:hypothetical protein
MLDRPTRPTSYAPVRGEVSPKGIHVREVPRYGVGVLREFKVLYRSKCFVIKAFCHKSPQPRARFKMPEYQSSHRPEQVPSDRRVGKQVYLYLLLSESVQI